MKRWVIVNGLPYTCRGDLEVIADGLRRRGEQVEIRDLPTRTIRTQRDLAAKVSR